MGAVHPTSRTISAPVEIVGERSKHLGPRIDYARVGLRAEPSGRFEVVDLVPRDDKARAFGFPEMFVRGVLDGLGGGAPPPLRLILQSADHHPIDSSPHAFVEAGRDAGRKLREHEGLI